MIATPGSAGVTAYWFGELSNGLADDTHRTRWFKADAAMDGDIRERFGTLLKAAADGALSGWAGSLEGALALVILCDQFSRQIHRGSADAYTTDPLALATARRVIESGDDLALAFDQRAFLYMPFQHSESRLDQHVSVGLFTSLRDTATDRLEPHADGFLHHARQHRDIVLRFGRFPHRNRVLRRLSTPEELEFLETASDFGQKGPAS